MVGEPAPTSDFEDSEGFEESQSRSDGSAAAPPAASPGGYGDDFDAESTVPAPAAREVAHEYTDEFEVDDEESSAAGPDGPARGASDTPSSGAGAADSAETAAAPQALPAPPTGEPPLSDMVASPATDMPSQPSQVTGAAPPAEAVHPPGAAPSEARAPGPAPSLAMTSGARPESPTGPAPPAEVAQAPADLALLAAEAAVPTDSAPVAEGTAGSAPSTEVPRASAALAGATPSVEAELPAGEASAAARLPRPGADQPLREAVGRLPRRAHDISRPGSAGVTAGFAPVQGAQRPQSAALPSAASGLPKRLSSQASGVGQRPMPAPLGTCQRARPPEKLRAGTQRQAGSTSRKPSSPSATAADFGNMKKRTAVLSGVTIDGVKKGQTYMAAIAGFKSSPSFSFGGAGKKPALMRSSSTPAPGSYDSLTDEKNPKYNYQPKFSFGGEPRFGAAMSLSRRQPGPGAYTPNDPVLAVSPKTGFGSSIRLKGPIVAQPNPGPGAYEVRSTVGQGPIYTAQGRHAVQLVHSKALPGPGAYNPSTQFTLTAPPKAGFGTSRREETGHISAFGPGPGTYELQNYKTTGAEAPKYSATSRHRTHDIDSYLTPGPGTYNSHTTCFGGP